LLAVRENEWGSSVGALERIDKVLSETGRFSRKEARNLVRKGQVVVNGVQIKTPESKVDPQGITLSVAGEEILWQRSVYLLLNKPAGLLTATEDRHQPTVLDLFPKELQKQGISPVGRLDKDTEGLLIFTNDGTLAHRLISPKYHVDKRYFAKTEGTVDREDQEAFAVGMRLEDGTCCLPAKLELAGENCCYVTLREGKFHQVKRMLAQCGKPVTYLKRLSMGPVLLDENLSSGAWRPLSEAEVAALRECCGLTEE
jgi:16S rRNA pseudouridine516 synthase